MRGRRSSWHGVRDARPLRGVVLLTLPVLVGVLLWLFLSARDFYRLVYLVPHKDSSVTWYGSTPKTELRQLFAGFFDKPRYYDEFLRLPFDELHLWIDRDELRSLLSNPPDSVREYKDGHLLEASGDVKKVRIRYRGDRPDNWMRTEKSWRVRLRKADAEGFRLINLKPLPRDLSGYVADLVVEKTGFPLLGQKIVRLYVNKEYKGLFRQFRQVNESYVRDLGRMPGDVFVGENIGRDELQRVYGNLFANAWYWSKAAVNNSFPDEHRPHLEDFFDVLASGSHDRLYRILDREHAIDAWAVCNLTGNTRMLSARNWRIYFDPLRGQFQILLYDTAFGEAESWQGELVPSRPFYVLLRDPELVAAVNLRMLEWLEDGILTQAAAELEATAEEIATSALGEEGVVREMERYVGLLRRREQFLKETLPSAELLWEQRDDELVLYTKAFLPLRLDGVDLDAGTDTTLVGTRLYPGRAYLPGLKKPVGHMPARPVFARTSYRLADATEVTAVRARIEGLGMAGPGTAVVARRVTAEEASALPLDEISIDPAAVVTPPSRERRFAGEVTLRQDLLVGVEDRWIVAPGTRFHLEPGVSIVVRRKVELQDVRFTGDANAPWGVVALQGSGAAGSTIRGCRFEHGSRDVVDHVEYSGMLSIHDVHDVRVEGNRFGRNRIADDTVRVAMSSVDFLDNEIVAARGDAVDYDLSSGLISGNTFRDSGNDAVDLMTSRVEIRGNRILNAGDKGISVGERSEPVVRDNVVVGCKTGIEIKDDSLVLAFRNVLTDNAVAVRLTRKNWRYATGGRAWFAETLFDGNASKVDVGPHSRLILQAVSAEGALRDALETWESRPDADLREYFSHLER